MKPKRSLIVYHERLGDVARCLPLAKGLSLLGTEVYFECRPEYHELFDFVGYAKPVNPGEPREGYGRVYDLQIWPNRFAEFEASGLNWMDFVYQPYPWVRRDIEFDYPPDTSGVPAWVREACLVFPNGYSQRNPPDPRWVILKAHQMFGGMPICVIGKKELGCQELPSIADLVAWISVAKRVLTVNTAPSILASAVRDDWHHIPDLDPRHDWQHERRIVVPRT
jgi:hypothetical protein